MRCIEQVLILSHSHEFEHRWRHLSRMCYFRSVESTGCPICKSISDTQCEFHFHMVSSITGNLQQNKTMNETRVKQYELVQGFQWRSQDILSRGQFPSGTVLRSGQLWAIDNQLGNWATIFQHLLPQLQLQPNFGEENFTTQLKRDLARFPFTISQMHSST